MESRQMNLKSLMKKFENYMTAAAFAEEGDFETAVTLAGTKKRVLLVLPGRRSDMKCFAYAKNFCKRMRADLEILCIENYRDTVNNLGNDLDREGIEYRVHFVDGCLKQAAVDVTRENPGIDYVVVNSYVGLETGCGESASALPDVGQMLMRPVVVVGA